MNWDNYIIILFAFAILYFANIRKDNISYLFSTMLFVIGGLFIIINKPIEQIYSYGLGIVMIFFGIYVGMRSSLEYATNNLNKMEVDNGRKRG